MDLEHPGLDLARRVRVRNKLQSIEIYTPRKDDDGNVVGLKQEIVLYDEEALVDPVRIVHILDKRHELNEGDPFVIMECIPQSFPIDGVTTPVSPGQTITHRVPDIYGRPWAEIWERYHEQGMERPRERPERPRRIIRSRCTTSARRTS